jgi:hypothetical protein
MVPRRLVGAWVEVCGRARETNELYQPSSYMLDRFEGRVSPLLRLVWAGVAESRRERTRKRKFEARPCIRS